MTLTPGGPILLVGFEPFAGRRRNRSADIVRGLRRSEALDRSLLPVDFSLLPREIAGLVARRPRALLLVGEWSGNFVKVEQVALNVEASEVPDNRGVRPNGEPVVLGGPLALSSSWDARQVAALITERAIPTEPSYHAGTFVCNAAFYLALHAAGGAFPVGFLHVPRKPWPRGPRLGRLRLAVEFALATLRTGTVTTGGPLKPG